MIVAWSMQARDQPEVPVDRPAGCSAARSAEAGDACGAGSGRRRPSRATMVGSQVTQPTGHRTDDPASDHRPRGSDLRGGRVTLVRRRSRQRRGRRSRRREGLPLLVGAGAASVRCRWPAGPAAGVGPRRQPLPGLLQPAGVHQPRSSAPEGRRRDPGAGSAADDRRARSRERDPRRGRAADHRTGAGGFRQGLLHQRGRRRQRERHPDGSPGHRPRQGHLALPLLPRQHRRGDRGRPATGDASRTSTPAGTSTSSVPTSTAPSSGRRPRRRSPSGRCTI